MVYYSPVEAKKLLSSENSGQLSLYMSKLGTTKEIFEKCLVGYLLDKRNIQFAISPLMR